MTHTDPFVPPAAEGLPSGALDSASAGASMLDAWGRTPYGLNVLAHALTQLARDGWLRTEPGEGFEPEREQRETPKPEAAPATDRAGAPDCDRCDGTGLDPDRYTEQQDPDGAVRYRAEPCADCQQPAVVLCGDQIPGMICTLPDGPHDDWKHRDEEGRWWSQMRIPPYSNRDRIAAERSAVVAQQPEAAEGVQR
jgi:hypothetical protein